MEHQLQPTFLSEADRDLDAVRKQFEKWHYLVEDDINMSPQDKSQAHIELDEGYYRDTNFVLNGNGGIPSPVNDMNLGSYSL